MNAEQELAALREGVEALADEWQGLGSAAPLGIVCRDLRALLAAHPGREGVGTGAGEGAPRQDTGSAWVTRSADCPEAPAQAHPLAHPGRDTAPSAECDGSFVCEAPLHVHGCFADRDGVTCDDPDDHRDTAPGTDALAEVERRITEAFPLNGELRHDGTSDPTAAAYVEGLHDAWSIVREVRAAADAPATEGGR